MKWTALLAALSMALIVGCECSKKPEHEPVDSEIGGIETDDNSFNEESGKAEEEPLPPSEEQEDFENLDESGSPGDEEL